MVVFTSMAISFRLSLSIRSRNGIFTLALPMMIFFLIPEMMKAVSGGAFLYPENRIAMTRITRIPMMINNIYPSSFFLPFLTALYFYENGRSHPLSSSRRLQGFVPLRFLSGFHRSFGAHLLYFLLRFRPKLLQLHLIQPGKLLQ